MPMCGPWCLQRTSPCSRPRPSRLQDMGLSEGQSSVAGRRRLPKGGLPRCSPVRLGSGWWIVHPALRALRDRYPFAPKLLRVFDAPNIVRASGLDSRNGLFGPLHILNSHWHRYVLFRSAWVRRREVRLQYPTIPRQAAHRPSIRYFWLAGKPFRGRLLRLLFLILGFPSQNSPV